MSFLEYARFAPHEEGGLFTIYEETIDQRISQAINNIKIYQF